MVFDPVAAEIFRQGEEVGALFLLELWVQVKHHLLDAPLLVSHAVDLVLHLLHRLRVAGGDGALVVT